MKKFTKIIAVILFLCVAFAMSLGSGASVFASEMTTDDILINAGFEEELVGKLSDYTKESLAYQVQNEEG